MFENLKKWPIENIPENWYVTRDRVQTVLDFVARSTPNPAATSATRMKIILDESVPQKLRLLIEGSHGTS